MREKSVNPHDNESASRCRIWRFVQNLDIFLEHSLQLKPVRLSQRLDEIWLERCSVNKIVFLLLFLLTLPGLAQEDFELSYLLVRSSDGAVLAEQQPDVPRTPASTMKVLTAVAAKQFLGLEYRFATQVETVGNVRRGRLHGDLVLRGSANPELDLEALQNLVDSLSKRGIRSVRGDLVVDPGPWSDPVYGEGWAWDDAGSHYSPEITGLSLDGGQVALDPKNLPSWVQRGEKENTSVLLRPGYEGILVGKIPERVTAPRMAIRTGEAFREALAARGIDVRGRLREGKESGEVVAVQWSRSLGELLTFALAKSDNLTMELLWRAANASAPEVLGDSKYRQADGSGLSRYNLISAGNLVKLLLEEKWLQEYLPAAGQGTLRERFPVHHQAKTIVAKTGSMSNVSGLVGYLYPGTARECVFAILINGHLGTYQERKAIEDSIVEGWLHLL